MRLSVVALVLASAPAWAPAARAQSVEARLDDLRLATAVRIALVEDTATRALDVDVAAEAGAVRLSGDGSTDETVVRVAQSVPGVRSVNGRGDSAPVQTVRIDPAPASPEPRRETPRTEAQPPATPAASAPARTGWGAAPDTPRTDTPGAQAPASPSRHTVSRGETLFSLARQYGTSVETLRRLNEMGPRDGIQVGQRLRVR